MHVLKIRLGWRGGCGIVGLQSYCVVFPPAFTIVGWELSLQNRLAPRGSASKDGGAWLASISLRCQTLPAAKEGVKRDGVSRRLRGVFADSLSFFEMKLSMGAGISPRRRIPSV